MSVDLSNASIEAFEQILQMNCKKCTTTHVKKLNCKIVTPILMTEHWQDFFYALKSCLKAVALNYTDDNKKKIQCIWNSFVTRLAIKAEDTLSDDDNDNNMFDYLIYLMGDLILENENTRNEQLLEILVDDLILPLCRDKKLKLLTKSKSQSNRPMHRIVQLITNDQFNNYYKRFNLEEVKNMLGDLVKTLLEEPSEYIIWLLDDLLVTTSTMVIWAVLAMESKKSNLSPEANYSILTWVYKRDYISIIVQKEAVELWFMVYGDYLRDETAAQIDIIYLQNMLKHCKSTLESYLEHSPHESIKTQVRSLLTFYDRPEKVSDGKDIPHKDSVSAKIPKKRKQEARIVTKVKENCKVPKLTKKTDANESSNTKVKTPKPDNISTSRDTGSLRMTLRQRDCRPDSSQDKVTDKQEDVNIHQHSYRMRGANLAQKNPPALQTSVEATRPRRLRKTPNRTNRTLKTPVPSIGEVPEVADNGATQKKTNNYNAPVVVLKRITLPIPSKHDLLQDCETLDKTNKKKHESTTNIKLPQNKPTSSVENVIDLTEDMDTELNDEVKVANISVQTDQSGPKTIDEIIDSCIADKDCFEKLKMKLNAEQIQSIADLRSEKKQLRGLLMKKKPSKLIRNILKLKSKDLDKSRKPGVELTYLTEVLENYSKHDLQEICTNIMTFICRKPAPVSLHV